MKVGTLVKVDENCVTCEGQGPGSYDEKLGYIIETFPREEIVKMILRRKFDDIFRKITGGKFWIRNHCMGDIPYGIESDIVTYVVEDLPNDYHENYDNLTSVHKVMLENGRYGWVGEYWLEEV